MAAVRAKNYSSNVLNSNVIGANLGAVYYCRILNNIIFAPTIGASFNKVKFKNHAEGKVVINALTTDKLSLYTGFSFSESFAIRNIKIVPEIALRVVYSPAVKASDIMLVEQTGEEVTYQPNLSKFERFRYTASVGFNIITHKKIALSISYKKDWQSRYSSDVAFAKFRVNF